MLKYVIILFSLYFIYALLPTFYYKLFDGRSLKDVSGENNIALTFDDGIDRIYTEQLLDLLNKYGVKASFFVVANTIEDNKHTLSRIVNEGHSLGLHSLEHKDALVKGYFYTRRDFLQSIKIMEDHNLKVKYFRPPWGHFNIFTLVFARKLKLKLILWSLMAGDWKDYKGPDEIISKLLKEIKSGSIVCLHDGRGTNQAPSRTIEALDYVLPLLLEQGFNFITMESINEY